MSTNDRWSGPYHIVDTRTNNSLESHSRQETAEYFCKIVNEHEVKNGREAAYKVEKR